MALDQKTQTPEEVQQEKAKVESTRTKLTSDIMSGEVFKSLDLPTGETQEVPDEKEETPDAKKIVEEVVEGSDQETEETTEETSEETEAAEEDEELVAKSKVQKRIDALTSRIKELESKISSQPEPEQAKDELTRKLESMSEDQLRQAKREARLAQIKYADDEDKVNELLDLEDKIDSTLRSIPQRFEQRQVREFNLAADRIASRAIEDGIDLNKAAEKIKVFALEIFRDTPEFQRSEKGQAKALELAYRHYLEIHRLDKGKSEVSRLKSQVNTLKKKTTLDSKVVKGNMDKTRSDEIRKNAITGTTRDKLAFVKDDPRFQIDDMIPPEFKEK